MSGLDANPLQFTARGPLLAAHPNPKQKSETLLVGYYQATQHQIVITLPKQFTDLQVQCIIHLGGQKLLRIRTH